MNTLTDIYEVFDYQVDEDLCVSSTHPIAHYGKVENAIKRLQEEIYLYTKTKVDINVDDLISNGLFEYKVDEYGEHVIGIYRIKLDDEE